MSYRSMTAAESTPSRASAPIRVVVVDDHPLVREGTQSALSHVPGIEVVGVAENGAEALRAIQTLKPDVLLLDVRLPDMNGLEVARRARALSSELAVLVLTGYDDTSYVATLLRLGVRGYLRKTASSREIVTAIRALAAGQTVLEPGVTQEVLQLPRTSLLTGREREVLEYLAKGRRNAEIATALGITEKAVEFHVTHVLEKLSARSRLEATVKARQLGLVQADA